MPSPRASSKPMSVRHPEQRTGHPDVDALADRKADPDVVAAVAFLGSSAAATASARRVASALATAGFGDPAGPLIGLKASGMEWQRRPDAPAVAFEALMRRSADPDARVGLGSTFGFQTDGAIPSDIRRAWSETTDTAFVDAWWKGGLAPCWRDHCGPPPPVDVLAAMPPERRPMMFMASLPSFIDIMRSGAVGSGRRMDLAIERLAHAATVSAAAGRASAIDPCTAILRGHPDGVAAACRMLDAHPDAAEATARILWLRAGGMRNGQPIAGRGIAGTRAAIIASVCTRSRVGSDLHALPGFAEASEAIIRDESMPADIRFRVAGVRTLPPPREKTAAAAIMREAAAADADRIGGLFASPSAIDAKTWSSADTADIVGFLRLADVGAATSGDARRLAADAAAPTYARCIHGATADPLVKPIAAKADGRTMPVAVIVAIGTELADRAEAGRLRVADPSHGRPHPGADDAVLSAWTTVAAHAMDRCGRRDRGRLSAIAGRIVAGDHGNPGLRALDGRGAQVWIAACAAAAVRGDRDPTMDDIGSAARRGLADDIRRHGFVADDEADAADKILIGRKAEPDTRRAIELVCASSRMPVADVKGWIRAACVSREVEIDIFAARVRVEHARFTGILAETRRAGAHAAGTKAIAAAMAETTPEMVRKLATTIKNDADLDGRTMDPRDPGRAAIRSFLDKATRRCIRESAGNMAGIAGIAAAAIEIEQRLVG